MRQFLKFAAPLTLAIAVFLPSPAIASCSSEWFAISGIHFEYVPGNQLARQAYEMRKSKAYADLASCQRRERAEAQQRRADELERAKIQQERARAEASERANQTETAFKQQQNSIVLADISKAVLDGRCEDAKTIALTNSRLDLADQAMRLCKPAPKKSK